MVVPGVARDRHPGGVERADVVAGEPVRPVQHDGHHEERRRDTEPRQDRQRGGVLTSRGVVERHEHRVVDQRRTELEVVGERLAGDGVHPRREQPFELAGEHLRRADQRPRPRAVGGGRLAHLVVAQHGNGAAGRDLRRGAGTRRRGRRDPRSGLLHRGRRARQRAAQRGAAGERGGTQGGGEEVPTTHGSRVTRSRPPWAPFDGIAPDRVSPTRSVPQIDPAAERDGAPQVE